MRHRDIELQNTIELRATAWELATKISLRMWPTRISLRTWQQNVTPIMQPLQQSATRDSTSEKNYAQMNNHSLQNNYARNDPSRNDPSRNRRTQEVPFIAGCSHFTQKNAKFALRLPPQHKRHATFMQPSQCILQHDVANPHVSMRMATPDDNNHNGSHYSNLQPEIQQANRTTHKWTATRCRKQRRNRLTSKRSKPQPPHTGGTLHRRLQPLYTQKHKVSCSGFLPKTDSMQHSCSHYTSLFCSLTPPFIECIVMWCKVSHHPSLSLLLHYVKSHTTFHWAYCCVM